LHGRISEQLDELLLGSLRDFLRCLFRRWISQFFAVVLVATMIFTPVLSDGPPWPECDPVTALG
jgi:hypothetical protein